MLTLVIALAAYGLYVTGIGCPIKQLSGIPCPSCGMTRAWYEALHLNFANAIAFHPLFWLAPPALASAVFLPYFNKKLFVLIMIGIFLAFIGVWAIRLAYAQGFISELFFPINSEVMQITNKF